MKKDDVQVGDVIGLEPCRLCGGLQYKEYEALYGYQDQMHNGWVNHRHSRVDSGDCIRYLASRVKTLEDRLDNVYDWV